MQWDSEPRSGSHEPTPTGGSRRVHGKEAWLCCSFGLLLLLEASNTWREDARQPPSRTCMTQKPLNLLQFGPSPNSNLPTSLPLRVGGMAPRENVRGQGH